MYVVISPLLSRDFYIGAQLDRQYYVSSVFRNKYQINNCKIMHSIQLKRAPNLLHELKQLLLQWKIDVFFKGLSCHLTNICRISVVGFVLLSLQSTKVLVGRNYNIMICSHSECHQSQDVAHSSRRWKIHEIYHRCSDCQRHSSLNHEVFPRTSCILIVFLWY